MKKGQSELSPHWAGTSFTKGITQARNITFIAPIDIHYFGLPHISIAGIGGGKKKVPVLQLFMINCVTVIYRHCFIFGLRKQAAKERYIVNKKLLVSMK